MQNALEQAFGGTLRFGAVVAFVVAATPFSLLGITAAFWALLAALAASLLAEREELLALWRGTDAGAAGRREKRLPVDIVPSAAYRVKGEQRIPIAAKIRNLSASGLLVRSERPLFAGNQLELAFQPTGGVDMLVRVDVRHVQHVLDGTVDLWEAGCEFHESDQGHRQEVVGFIMGQARAAAA